MPDHWKNLLLPVQEKSLGESLHVQVPILDLVVVGFNTIVSLVLSVLPITTPFFIQICARLKQGVNEVIVTFTAD